MGLAKKLRITVEEVVLKYVGEQLNDLQDRVAALEDGSDQAIEALERQTTKALAKIAAFLTNEGHYNCKGLSPDATADVVIDLLTGAFGTSEHESLHSQVNRLAKFIMDEIPGEPLKNEGAIDTAIRAMEDLLAYPRAAPTDIFGPFRAAWSPTALGHLMPKANPNSDKLPNEVRVRLHNGDERIDLTMLVAPPREGQHESILANAVPVIGMPFAGGALNVIAPADVPTAFSNRIFEVVTTHVARSDDKERAKLTLCNCVHFEADVFDRQRAAWLPSKASVVFGCRRFLQHGTQLGDGISFNRLVEEYGEHAATLCLVGSSFLEATFNRLEESSAPPADPPAPSPSP